MSEKKKEFYHCIPILIILCILPFVVRLHVYKENMEDYAWYGMDGECTDFFSYGKAVIFGIVTAYMAIKLIWEILQGRWKISKGRYLYLFAGAAACLVLSAICAKEKGLALWGGYQRFEGLFVLLGYFIVCIYSYYFIKDDKSRNIIINGLAVTAGIFCIIGFCQMAGKDPVFFPWVQKWIVPAGLQDVVLESRIKQNTVYFTLGNANYASMYFAGLLPVFGLSAVKNKGTKRIAFGILSVAMFICLIFTYSRVGIVMLFVVLLSGAWMCRKIWTKYWKKCLICLAGAVIVFVVSDGMTGFRFGERIMLTVQSFTEKRTNCDLEELYTKQDGIYFTLHGVSVKMYARYGLGEADTLQLVQNDGKNISDSYNENTGEIAVPGLEEVSIFTEELDGESVLFFCVGETVFRFVKDTDNGYLYYTGNGKYDTIEPVQQFGFRGMEHMASGRFYIWSRTLPMLKKYGLFGCGEDNFYLHYPQNDYLGKAQYCSNPLTVIEKPHNTYLLIAVQNGIPALLFLLLLYCLYFKESLKLYSGKSCYDSRQWTGLIIFLFSIGYMAGYLFVDSSVNISPLFWVLLGMGKRCNEELFEKGN